MKVKSEIETLGEDRYCLPVQSGVSYDGAKASTARKIESYDLVPGDAVESPVGAKAQTAGSAEQRNDGVVAFAIGADARGKEECAASTECKPARKRHDPRRQNVLSCAVQRSREGHDRAGGAQSDVITAVGSEGTPAWVQLGDRSGVPYDSPVPIERQDSIASAVEKEQFFL